jgi:hypothetical protein
VTQKAQSGSACPPGWLCATCTIPTISTSATQTIPMRDIHEERARSREERKRMILNIHQLLAVRDQAIGTTAEKVTCIELPQLGLLRGMCSGNLRGDRGIPLK